MKKYIWYYIYMILVFLSGFVVAMNIAVMYGTSPDYEASWTKVGVALFLAFLFAFKGAFEIVGVN